LQDQITQRRRRALAQIEALKADIDADESELRRVTAAEEVYLRQVAADANAIANSRAMGARARDKK
jgi:circadian clock protein KaiC